MNLAVRFDEENMPAPASCMSAEHGCVMFDCLVHLWEWIDPPVTQTDYQMENKKNVTATQQPVTQQHLMAHHVHPDQIYSPQQTQLPTLVNNQAAQIQQNGVMHQLLQSQYHSNMNARSPLLENKHEMYGTGHNHDYVRHYGANDNYNYPQSPPRIERTEIHTDHNVNHELLQNMPKGYNAEVYQDYMKRNPPKDNNQIYQNHQPMYRPNMNQYGSKPYLPYSNRIGPQSNTELLRRQYNEIQQMKMQQQMHYQNQAQMHQQQKFAERQLLLQQIHGVQPPPNLQNSIYSDSSYRDLDRYSSKNDFKEYSSNDIQRDMERYAKNYDYNDMDIQNRQYQENQWQTNHNDYRESERQRYSEHEKSKSQSPPSDYSNQKTNSGVVSPMKSSESSTPSIKSPSSDSRRSSSGTQALRSPTAQRIPSAPVTMSGMLYKQGSDGLKVWRKRWFVLSEYCLFYYKSQDEEKLLGSVLLPSYKVSACSAEDKVMRKFAFKLEHANMRTYVLAALDQEAMMKWVKALTMAALMQNTNEQKQNDRSAKSEESNEEAGPTYANAPPKPRRSNDGYNSPSPDMYDPNYDLLRKPASQYSQGTSHTRTNYIQETYRSPQNPLQSPYQTKRSYDMQQLSLPLTNTTENLDNQNVSIYKSNPQSPYDNRLRNQHTKEDEEKIESLYDKKPNYNPFLQDYSGQERQSQDNEDVSRVTADMSKTSIYSENYSDNRSIKSHDPNVYNREMYGDVNMKNNKTNTNMNERTPETYGRTNASAYNEKIGDYEDIYSAYNNDNGKLFPKSPNPSQSRDTVSLSSHKSPQEQNTNYVQEKTFSGPSVLRRKKMQASGIQPTMPRPHSADFLEYESKNEALNNAIPIRKTNEQTKQPQRPKSSLDINSYYDPSSDKYYSEESYAEKMRQSAQYLQQQNMGPKNIRIPLEKYASGLAEKQLHSPYNQNNNNNYETEFNVNRTIRDQTNYASKIQDHEGMNSNWTLKEKDLENQKEYLNRSGSVMSDGSNVSAIIKDSRFDPSSEGFMRSASARLPSERDRDKKVQQREESMKRLLEWKQRMLQSPLTRKSTPATISLARSLNQSRQSLRSDQYKPKTYKNASYNSYSSDDEEESPGTELQNMGNMQAGRSDLINITCPTLMQTSPPHAVHSNILNDKTDMTDNIVENITKDIENTYENILCSGEMTKTEVCDNIELEDEVETMNNTDYNLENAVDVDEGGYVTNDSEAESETQLEYTDNDLDEVLLESDIEVEDAKGNVAEVKTVSTLEETFDKVEPEQLPARPFGEDHYLPMSPRKMSAIEPAHKTIIDNLSDYEHASKQNYEDNHYVEMNLGTDDDSMQTYELVCVNNGRVEPVYMELNNIVPEKSNTEDTSKSNSLSDTTSHFADTKEQTLKRISKGDKNAKEKLEFSDVEEDPNSSKLSLDSPFSRFSISDTFRPASYYLSGSRTILDRQDSSDSDIPSSTPIFNSPSEDNLLDEELSRYILDKLDKSDISQDNSIIKMLTSENQKMNKMKRKTTSLMIYGSRTSIHDTLTRGEKVRNSRASLTNDLNKTIGSACSLLSNSNIEQNDPNITETESLKSYNADKGSSRLSIESDVSSKFDMATSNISSEIQSLIDSDSLVDLRHPYGFRNLEDIKRRPLSDDSLFELTETENYVSSESMPAVNLDTYLQRLQEGTSDSSLNNDNDYSNNNRNKEFLQENNLLLDRIHTVVSHTRSSSTPVKSAAKNSDKNSLGARHKYTTDHGYDFADSQSSCSSTGIPKSPTSFYRKNCHENTLMRKNLNSDVLVDKIKEFDKDKLAQRTDNGTSSSSVTTGFHSRESSTEHSAPYYYSDLSSQEHINVLPTSHYLKKTNIHRKLNNQRRRGPMHKNNEISHIRNPIRNNQVSDQQFDLVASARSVSVEFLSVVEKNPDIDLKNIYVSTGGKTSKIPESLSLISSLGCKNSTKKKNLNLDLLEDANISNHSNVNTSIPVSSESMSSHCSGNSSNTVYYDAETEANAYENVLYHGEKHWDEDIIWRDNLRRVSHRHARSMDDLDTMPTDSVQNGSYVNTSSMNSIKRIKKCSPDKSKKIATYVNCDIQSLVQRRNIEATISKCDENDENDVYVSLANDSELPESIEGVYEQLAIDTSEQSRNNNEKNRKKFEIDRENLRQWDLMSSGLMKDKKGRVRSTVASRDNSDEHRIIENGTESTSNEGIL
ncbi:unnamed protein product [Danaus chrysippus]|uniref:(African queen) hypothetical protein n=1 Tax=Danaus chrysippus TaxID=151541 RepID=A0A8J2VVU3_9NEOP|nr:unnamed protein product [Danaus chrysippus]